MKKCQYIRQEDNELPCTGVHFNEDGECVIHYMDITAREKAIDAKNPYGCYRRRDVPERKNISSGFTNIGAASCISTYTEKYKATTITFNPPFSAMKLVTYCNTICSRHNGCVAYTAADQCTIFLKNVAKTVSKTEMAFVQKPFGCYVKDSFLANNSAPAEITNSVKELTQVTDNNDAPLGGVKPEKN